MPFGRPAGILEKSGWPSGLPAGQALFGWGRLRGAELADHWLRSEAVDSAVPLDCEPFVATVVLEDTDELEEMEDDELLRGRVFRGTNMPRTSSGFIGLFPLIVPHAGREICGNVGGLATAVMRKAQLGRSQ
jgi:hypothetical protein